MKNSLLKKSFSFLLAVVMLFTMVPAGVFAAQENLPVMMMTNAASSKGYYKYYSKIYTITFLDEIKVEGEPLEQWDMSAAGDGSVWGWMYLNEEATAAAGENRYDVYVAGNGGVAVHPNSTHLFYMFENLVTVNNPENLKTSGVTSFKLMFSKCYDLISVDMSSWDTRSVTNMNGIFDMSTNTGAAPALTSVDLTGWNTSIVTDMSYMFYNCSNLDNLDLSSFNTEKVTNMSNMFYRCLSLENIYIGNGWTVESVNNANAMFNCCYAIVGGKETYDKDFQYIPPGKEYAKLKEDGGFLTPRPVDGLTCDEGLVVLYPESTYELTVKVNPETAYDSSLTYTSSDESIVTVDENGVITAVSEGTVKITVASNADPDKSVEITVTVKNPEVPVGSVTVDKSEVNLTKGDTDKITVTVNPENATNKEVTYKSTDESVVTVDKFGNITATGEGEAEIIVTSEANKEISVSIPVKVEAKTYKVTYAFVGDVIPENVNVPDEEVYKEGSTVFVESAPTADGYIFNGWTTEDADITSGSFVINNDVHIVGSWEKLYKVIYKYDENYVVPEGAPEIPDVEFWYAPGEDVPVYGTLYFPAYIFIGWTTDDAEIIGDSFTMPEDDVVITGFFKKPVESIEFMNDGDVVIDIDKEIKINVYVKPEDATIKDLVYESSNPDVVTVDKDGKIVAVGEGTATVTVKSADDPTKSDTITVTVKIPVTDITVKDNDITIGKDETYKIEASVDSEATNKNLTFESSDPETVTVDKDGNITALKDGTVTITVKSEDNSDVTETITVTVYDPVTEITAPDEIVLELDDVKDVDAKVNDNATNKGLVYETSDSSVVKVDNYGNVVAVGEGTATITVISKDNPDIKKEITVTVIKKYKVTYEIIGDVRPLGVSAPASKIYDNGSTVYVSKGYNYEGYVFSGWSTDDVTVTDGKFIINKDVHFTGYFKKSVTDIVIGGIGSELVIGDKGFVDVTVYPNDATDKSMTYSSSDDSIIKVDENGNFEAVGEGTATITVISKDNPDVKKEITVTVKKPVVPVDEVVVVKKFITIRNGETDKITATVKPDDATNKELIYTSSDENVVKVDKDGNIIATGEGSAVITVTLNDGNPFTDKRAQVVVTVIKAKVPVTSVEASKEEIKLVPGGSETITVKVNPDDATDKTVTYKSSNPDVAKVDEKGNIVAVGEGEAIITITSKDDPTKTDTIKVTVKAPEEPDEPEKPVYTVTVPDGINLLEGESKNIGVVITPDDGTIRPVYTSGDTSIVTVDAEGNITGIKAGVTTISVDLGNGDIRVIPVVVAAPAVPRKHHVCFGKTDGIGWYEVSVNGGDFFPQGPNSTLEVDEGSILVVRVQDMWIDDEFDFYVNGSKVPMDPANTITVVVDGYMLIGALSMDTEVPDVDESLTLLEKITNFFAKIINWFKNLFK